MSDDNEPSAASAGSAAGPVAYGVVYPDGTTGAVGWRWEDCVEVAGVSDVIVPLYRQPQHALTAEEQEAIQAAAVIMDARNRLGVPVMFRGSERAATLRGLLERTK